jgi:hypothetical protein
MSLNGASGTSTRSVRLGTQTAFGVPVVPNLRPAFGLDPDNQRAVTPLMPVGTRFSRGVMVGKGSTKINLNNSKATFNDLVLIFQSLIGQVAASGNVYEWIPQTFATDVYRLYTFDIGDASWPIRMQDCFADGVSMTFKPNADIPLTGSFTGTTLDESDTVVLDPNPTTIPVIPLESGGAGMGTDVYVSDTLAGLETATRVGDVQAVFGYANPRNPLFTNDTSTDTYSDVVDLAPGATGSLVVPKKSSAVQIMTWAQSGADFFVRYRNTGPTVGGVQHLLEIDMPCNANDNPGASGADQNAYTRTFPLIARHDDTLGGALRIRITTATAGL